MQELVTLVRDWTITATAPETADKSEFINKRHIIIEAQYRNTEVIYINITTESLDKSPKKVEEYDVLRPNQAKFFGAPKNRKIKNIYAYTTGTQYINIYSSDGTILHQKTIVDWDSITPELEVSEGANDSDKLFSAGADEEWLILWIHIEYTSTATVGNRIVGIEFRDEVDDSIYMNASRSNQAESLTWYYNLNPCTENLTQANLTVMMNLPNPCILPPLYDMRIRDRAGIDASADDMILQILVKKRKVN